MNTLIGFDFSIAKPAATIYSNNIYYFYIWPKDLIDKNEKIYKDAGIIINKRNNIECNDIVKYDIINSDFLSDMIINNLSPFINKNTTIAFEGSSFNSKGNVTLSLTAWRYILIYKLSKLIPLDNIYTFAPISIKKIAGCSKRGTTKSDMIESFINMPTFLGNYIRKKENLFKTKNGNWISNLDDIADSYWVIEALRSKMCF